MHQDAYSRIEEIKKDVQNLSSTANVINSAGGLIQITIDAEHLPRVAELDSIKSIEPLHPVVCANDRTRVILKVEEMNKLPGLASPGGLTGKGQVVAITDTGLDTNHPAFEARVLSTRSFNGGKSIPDIDGHGTHCAATMVGSAGPSNSSQFPPSGMAPNAKLIAQSFMMAKIAAPLIHDIFGEEQAMIHNNSWYIPVDSSNYAQRKYLDTDAFAVDEVVYNRPELLVVFCAGNEGNLSDNVLKSQIGSYGSAKNVLTVGASASDRAVDFSDAGWDVVNETSQTRRSVDTVVKFSSRGPTAEGRRKPDVVAPGTAILSALSKDVALAKVEGYAAMFGSLSGANSSQWMYLSGTSQAAAAVSGCAALLREALSAPPFNLKPSEITSALLKALLINGAVDTTSNQSGPNNTQGYGRIDMERAIRPLSRGKARDFRCQTARGGEPAIATECEDSAARMPSTGKPIYFKATLVYIDFPGSELYSLIHLFAQVMTADRMGARKGDGHPNTVRQVLLKDVPPESEVKITVTFTKVFKHTTHWALVWDFYEHPEEPRQK